MQKYSQKEVLAYCLQNQIAFSISRYPGQNKNTLLISDEVHVFEKNELSDFLVKDGYVIAPFSFENDKGIFLENTIVIEDFIEEDLFNEIVGFKSQDCIDVEENMYADYDTYLKQFEKIFSSILEGKIEKAILSRVKHLDSISISKAVELYYNLSIVYPNAYSFMFFSPQSGLWAGATPELLLNVSNEQVHTVSLAGTKRFNNKDQHWNKKELDEQQYVSDYMEKLLNGYQVLDFEVKGPESIKAGKISHLKTEYNFPIEYIKSQIGDFVKDLHPTPAVCGLPKNVSMKVIQDVEKHSRSYYAGFIGRTKENGMSLYVNIRSLKFVDQGVDLYLGGGITADSDPIKEWNETELKAGTLLDVIKELNKK